MMTTLTARPEAITFDPQQSALIVVDMQNAYATPGGYLDLAGFDVSTTRPVIANIQTAVTAARAAGMLIIWFQNGWDEQYVEAGGPGSPNFHKSNALKTMRKQPQLLGKLLAKGPGIINWWMNWCRSLAILCCRSRATAVSSIRRWTAFCAAVEYAIWFSPVSLPTSASNRRYAMAFFWSISAWCWKTQHTRRGLNLHRKPRCSISKPFLAGSATSKRSATRFLPRPLLVSLKEFNDAKIRNYSRWQQRTAGPLRSRHAG